jgi:mannobiose 2-epimerase
MLATMTGDATNAASLTERLAVLAERMMRELCDDLIPFWLALYDPQHGGHYGHVDLAGTINRTAPKTAIVVARLLWFLSTVGYVFGDGRCLEQAARTKAFLLNRVYDRARGGLFWAVTHDGRPADPTKHLYAQAFGIYSLSSHAATAGDAEALGAAKELFVLLESRVRRAEGGYAEAFDAAWQPIEDRRIAWQGGARTITANSHIHLVEAYTALVRAWPSPGPRAALADLVRFILDRFVTPDGTSLYQALDADLRPLPSAPSFGHDIEASWLLDDAGDALGDAALQQRLRRVAASLATAAASRAQLRDGGFLSSAIRADAASVPPRVWWVQAEAIVGLVNVAQQGGPPGMMTRAEALWGFIERVMIDRENGEWFEAVDGNGRPLPDRPKVGPWKEPYHQARACLEIMRRAGILGSGGAQAV